jgi:hypothetical protein
MKFWWTPCCCLLTSLICTYKIYINLHFNIWLSSVRGLFKKFCIFLYYVRIILHINTMQVVCRTVAESLPYLVHSRCCTSLCKHVFMSTLSEQHVHVKICFKLGKTFTEAFEMLQNVFGDETMSCTRTYEGCRRFKDGRTLTEDDPR